MDVTLRSSRIFKRVSRVRNEDYLECDAEFGANRSGGASE